MCFVPGEEVGAELCHGRGRCDAVDDDEQDDDGPNEEEKDDQHDAREHHKANSVCHREVLH